MQQHRVVIGRGISGLTTALNIIQNFPQDSLTIIGPKPDEDYGASRSALGVMSHKGLILGKNPVFAKKMVGGAELLRETQGKGVPYLLGMMEPFSSLETFRKKKERCYHRYPAGAFLYETWEGDQARNRFGRAYTYFAQPLQWSGCLFYPQDGWFHPRDYLSYLTQKIKTLGGQFIDGKVQKLISHQTLALSQGGLLSCDRIILAAGFGTGSLLSSIQMPHIYESLGETHVFKAPTPDFPSGVFKFGRQSLISYDQTIYAGGFFPGQDEEKSDLDLLRLCRSLSFVEKRQGVRVYLKNKDPYVGPVAFPSGGTILLNFGYDKNGFALAKSGAQQIVDYLRD